VVDDELFVPGDEAVVVFVVLLELDEPDGSLSFTTVVLFSFVFSAAGVTVVSFCSHPVRNATVARMQIYLII
jgi:hypothetical protein